MPNNWFQFKHFLIKQEHAAMKVTTDACLFGAWIAEKMMNKPIARALDIGTGTGLLSLMLAQKIPALFDAVEIDKSAALEADQNVRQSAYASKIVVHQNDILMFPDETNYDLIFSNPPFFDRSLRSPLVEVNLARHESELTLEQLFLTAGKRLSPDGCFALLLPFVRWREAEQVAARHGFATSHQCLVRTSEKHDFFRVMLVFQAGLNQTAPVEEITIKNDGQYSEPFLALLKDYYLHF